MNNELTKEFIPFKEAKELKALGFDEPCLMCYRGQFDLYSHSMGGYASEMTLKSNTDLNRYDVNQKEDYWLAAPTWRQAFKFFRDKFKLDSFVSFETIDDSTTAYVWNIVKYLSEGKDKAKDTWDFYDRIDSFQNMDWYDNNEEAELACLKKLIEIAKKAKPKDPHEVSKVKCDLCSYTWVAVRPEGLTKIECPHCGNMVNFENIPLD